MSQSPIYYQIAPPTHLKSLIKFLWIFEGDYSESHLYQQPTTASVFPTLTFLYRGAFQHSLIPVETYSTKRSSSITGPTIHPAAISTNQKVGVLGVCLYSQTLEAVIGIPASKLFNYSVDLFDIGHIEISTLANQVGEASSNQHRIKLVTSFFEKQLFGMYSKLIYQQAADYIQLAIKYNGKMSMKDLARQGHVSQRHFERIFKRTTGFSPIAFTKVIRFENAIGKFYSGRYSKFTDLAYDSGYYDQAHFIREFKIYSGQTPKNYFQSDLSYFFE